MSSIDSVPWFAQRIREVGLYDLYPEFTRLGWTTAATFAFATTVAPGQGDPAAALELFKREVVEALTGQRNDARVVSLRRLHFLSLIHI